MNSSAEINTADMAGPGSVAPLRGAVPLVGMAAAGAMVSLSLGVYANVHDATGQSIVTFGFSSTLAMKAWLASGAALLALVQAASALAIFGRFPGVRSAPPWIGQMHRWTGTAAFLLTLPVAYHCLWALGFRSDEPRVLIHSLLGCAFYGAFTTKMLVLHSRRVPARALPSMGALLVILLVGIWTTSSWWYFTTFGFPST